MGKARTIGRRIYRKRNGAKNTSTKQNAQPFFDFSPQHTFFSSKSSDSTMNRKCEDCKQEEKDDKVQREKSGANTNASPSYVSSYVNSLSGKGSPLPPSTRQFFEPKFQADFSNVKVHNNDESKEAASSINAKAFTFKNHIVFNKGQYDTESSSGKKLLAHELTHVIQQDKGISRMEVEKQEEEKLQREPEMMGVLKERYSYSTNCGWIDWGHANPTMPKKLIDIVKDTADKYKKKDEVFQQKITAELPAFVTEDKCPKSYEKDEVKNSASDNPVVKIKSTPSGAVDIRVGGFAVNSFDTSKFKNELKTNAQMISAGLGMQGALFDVRIGGFTDCIGEHQKNRALRSMRGTMAYLEMAKALPGKVLAHIPFERPTNQFLESNATREGRMMNRGVLIQLIPHASAEVGKGPEMEASHWGITLTKAVPTFSVNKTLSNDEVVRAALTTFMLQSVFFEAAQSWTDFVGNSSFSEEDLVSNLIGFYRAANGYSKNDIVKICDVWDAMKSFEKFKSYSFQKNKTFRPLTLPPGGSWPKELSSIKPFALNAENFSILSMFIQPAFAAPGKCSIDADTGALNCS